MLFSRIDEKIIVREIIYRNRCNKKDTLLYSLLSVINSINPLSRIILQFMQSITLNLSINRS